MGVLQIGSVCLTFLAIALAWLPPAPPLRANTLTWTRESKWLPPSSSSSALFLFDWFNPKPKPPAKTTTTATTIQKEEPKEEEVKPEEPKLQVEAVKHVDEVKHVGKVEPEENDKEEPVASGTASPPPTPETTAKPPPPPQQQKENAATPSTKETSPIANTQENQKTAEATSSPATTTDVETGTVKWFNFQKGFGFIVPSGGGGQIFAHQSDILAEEGLFRSLMVGEVVEFKTTLDEKGRTRAQHITGPNGTDVKSVLRQKLRNKNEMEPQP